MAKLLLFAFVGGLAGFAGALVGEGVLAGWPAVAGGMSVSDTVAAYLRVAAWTACIGVVRVIGLVVGQNLYLRRRPIGLRQLLVVTLGSLAAGLLAGVAGQAMQRGLEGAAGTLSDAARTELAQGLGWMLLGGLLAACIAMFVSNLPKLRAAVAGSIGGGLGAWAFFDLSQWGGDTAGRRSRHEPQATRRDRAKNLSTRKWTLMRPQGQPADLPAGNAAGIEEGYRINVGSVTGSLNPARVQPAAKGRRSGPLVRGSAAAIVATGLIAGSAADCHRRHPDRPPVVPEQSLPITILSMAEAGAKRPLRLGVLPTEDGYDDIGAILKDLGAGYTYVPLTWDAVTKGTADLEKFDVLFLPCPGPPTDELSPDEAESLRTAMRDYVATGGTLYASCLAWTSIAATFPAITTEEFRDRKTRLGLATKEQEISAEVVDAGMREQFGDTVALSFDLGGWYPPQFRGRGATVYLRGSFDLECDFDVIGADLIQKMKDLREKAEGEERAVNEETAKLKADFNAGRIDRPTAERAVDRLIQQTMENRARNQAVLKQLEQEMTELIAFAERESNRAGPLLAKMPFEDGFILFTAFHNGKQRSRRQVDLLRHLVYTTVTARLEARTKEQLVEAGFTAARHDLVTRSPGSPERTGTYACSRPGPLRFALGFNGEGVRLRLDLTSPDGRTATHETTEPVVVEVPDAVAGDWTYTVTAARLPSDNFPFTITIAEN